MSVFVVAKMYRFSFFFENGGNIKSEQEIQKICCKEQLNITFQKRRKITILNIGNIWCFTTEIS